MNHDHPTAPACDVCAKPVDDPAAYVCRRCAEVLGGRLGDVVALAAEVETTVARLARYADAHGRPLPGRPRPPDRHRPDPRSVVVLRRLLVASAAAIGAEATAGDRVPEMSRTIMTLMVCIRTQVRL